jgi:hypothetical protein
MTRSVLFFTTLLIIVSTTALARQPQAPIDATTYPREISDSQGKVLVHHPVIADWRNFELLSGWAPVEVSLVGSKQRWTGSVSFEVHTVIHYDKRLVTLRNGRVLAVKFSGQQPPQAVTDLARNAVNRGAQSVVLDFLIRALPDDFQIPGAAQSPPQLNHSPPRIVVSNHPIDLMLIDGPPSTAAISGLQLEYVVNTNWDIFHHTGNEHWYILKDGAWLQNTMLAGGDWTTVTDLPQDFLNLQFNSDWEYVAKALPPRQPDNKPLPLSISYEPAELIVINGKAQLEKIAGTNISYVTNTDSDLFVLDGQYYLLVSGRWFRTKNIKRKWYAAGLLPKAFANIPPDSEKGHVLATVPGTPQARVAMIEAAIPHVVEFNASQGGDVAVKYAGEPEFVDIQGTDLRRAQNTPFQIIQNNNFYYLCHEGAWYSSTEPAGPWHYATEVPEAIYTIPPTDPAYNVTFVKVNSFDDSSNRVAYSQTSGYHGSYSTGSSVVYGTGWYYPGTIHRYGHGYPAYGHYPRSYGWGARYHPAYGRYYPRGAYWGHYPYPMNTSATYDVTPREKDWQWDLDGNKRQVYDHGNRNYVGSGTYRMNGAKMADVPTHSSANTSTRLTAANNGIDDLYSSPDGEVYRKRAQGWQKLENSHWTDLPKESQDYLDRQYEARQTGYRNYDLTRETGGK